MSSSLFVPLTNRQSYVAPKKENCVVCGARNIKVHRRYKSETYCINCYFQWFKKKSCAKCGESYRFHIKDEKLICPTCLRNQPCMRCGKEALINGTNTEYGRVCQVCNQNYFKDKKACSECGELKANLSRYPDIGYSQPICQNCYQKHTHETCPCCHRYRKLVETEHGKKCQKCYEKGQIPCPSCQEPMWAGVGEKCWDCYWSQKLAQAVNLNQFIFNHEHLKNSYTDFSAWLSKNKGAKVASIKHNNFIDFFVRCDELWGVIPPYDLLVSEFKPNGLRKYLTVLRWLTTTGQIEINQILKDRFAEEERISQLLAKLGDETPIVVQNYYVFLLERQRAKETALKTLRLSLQPVVDIYHQFDLKQAYTPSQEQIDTYLKKKSGQANSLSSFLVFLRENYQVKLDGKPPKKLTLAKIKKKDAENELIRLSKLVKPLSKKDKLKWMQMSLIYFHGLTIDVKTLKKCEVYQQDHSEMQSILFNKKEYLIPVSEFLVKS